MSTRDLINAIHTGDSVAIQSEFEGLMAAKVSDRLDVMQQSVAQSMFRTPVEESGSTEAETTVDVTEPAEAQGDQE